MQNGIQHVSKMQGAMGCPQKMQWEGVFFRVYMQTSKMAHHTFLSPPHMERGGTHQNAAYYCVYKYIERSLHLFYLYIYNGLFVLYYFMHCIFISQTSFRPFLCSLSHVDTPHVPHHSVPSPTPLLSQPCVDGMIGLHPRSNTRIYI